MKICKDEEKHILTIINVYAPRTALIRKDNTILDDLYLDLSNLINEQKSYSTIIILAGDFNAKEGKQRHTYISCLGKLQIICRSFSNTLTNTDHCIVVTEMNIQIHCLY